MIQFAPTIMVLIQNVPFEIPSFPIPLSNQFFDVEVLDNGGWNLHPKPGKIDEQMWLDIVNQANLHNYRSVQLQMCYNNHMVIKHEMYANFNDAYHLVKSGSDSSEQFWQNFYDHCELEEVIVFGNVDHEKVAMVAEKTGEKDEAVEINDKMAERQELIAEVEEAENGGDSGFFMVCYNYKIFSFMFKYLFDFSFIRSLIPRRESKDQI